MRRLGIYGGAFDPPHLAHEALAHAAAAQYALDMLLILPTGHAWHKSRTLTAAVHRLAMAKLGFADVPQASVDGRELLRNGPTYTFDTLQELMMQHPQAELFLLMGEDQLAFFPQWHRYAEIVQIATLLVALRADSVPVNNPKEHKKQGKIAFSTIHMPASPISATLIRNTIRQLGATSPSLDDLVKPSVARYIAEHRLYSLL